MFFEADYDDWLEKNCCMYLVCTDNHSEHSTDGNDEKSNSIGVSS